MEKLKFVVLLAALMTVGVGKNYAHDIEVANSDGVTIYYNFTNNKTELVVTYQGNNSFSGAYTGKVVIPESVAHEGEIYPVTSIGDAAFEYCRVLTEVTIPNCVASIGNWAFYKCSGLTELTIGNSVTSIGEWAFCECNGLTELTIPNSVTSIGRGAFYYCTGLTELTIGNSVTSIGNEAFENCRVLTELTIPNSVTSIGDMAFRDCSGLTELTIPNSVTSIGKYAFYYCTGLTELTIGNSVTSIGYSALSGCSSLTTLYSLNTTPPSAMADVYSAFDYRHYTTVNVFVPQEALAAYQTAEVWKNFKSLQAIGGSTKDNLHVDNYEPGKITFDLCNGAVYETTWSDFSNRILQIKLNNMSINAFDNSYEAVCHNDGFPVNLDDVEIVTPNSRIRTIDGDNANNSQYGYHLKLYNFGNDIYGREDARTQEKMKTGHGDAYLETGNQFEDKELGLGIFWTAGDSTPDRHFTWELSKEEVEYLTHDKELPVTVTRWFCFNAKNNSAPYPNLWVKMTIVLDRTTLRDKFGEKNRGYWFEWNTGLSAWDNSYEWSAVVADIGTPAKECYISSYPFSIQSTLKGNVECTSGTRGLIGSNVHKYFFAPKDVTVTGEILQNGQMVTVTRTITTNGSEQSDFNKLFCKHIQSGYIFDKNANATGAGAPSIIATIRTGDSHSFNATKKADDTWEWDWSYERVLGQCALDYTRGAFANKYLYSNGIKIAEMDQLTGDIVLMNNAEAKLVLNLVGYKGLMHENINKELRNWVAVASTNGCGVASKVVDYEHTPYLHSFMVSWQRPINLDPLPDAIYLDANAYGSVIYLLDLLRLYDWRGDRGDVYPKTPNNQGYMYDNHYWFWAYYGINGITIDMANVWTNMHQSSVSTFVRWNSVATKAELMAWDMQGFQTPSVHGIKNRAVKYTFDLLNPTAYNDPDMEEELEEYMGLRPRTGEVPGSSSQLSRKERFGAIYYANNGDNAEQFDLRIPVTIHYAWGDLSDIMTVHIINGITGLNKITILPKPVDVYSLDGKLVRKNTTTLNGLKGIYIIDGKKIVLK